MDAVEFIKERDRMCRFYHHAGDCYQCPAKDCECSALEGMIDDDNIVAIVEEWAAAHPRKTRQDVASVLHGRWIEDERTYPGAGLSNNLCSVCGRVGGTWKKGLEPERKWRFCPNCGAKMGGANNAKG